MISISPDSYINMFHINFYFQENISAETVILRTFQVFREAPKTDVKSFFTTFLQPESEGVTQSSFTSNSKLHNTKKKILPVQYMVFDLQLQSAQDAFKDKINRVVLSSFGIIMSGVRFEKVP